MMGLFGPNVKRMVSENDIEGLKALLNPSQKEPLRLKAIQAMEQLRAIGPLAEALSKEPKDALYHNILKAVLNIVDECSINTVISALEDEDSQKVIAVMEALGALATTKVFYKCSDHAVAGIMAKYKDRTREAAVKTLQRIGTRVACEALARILDEEMDSRIRQMAERALVEIDTEVMLIMQGHGSPDIDRLKRIGTEKACEALVQVIKNAEREHIAHTAQYAIQALINIGVTAIKPVSQFLKDGEFVNTAIYILGEIGGEQAVNPLVSVMEDDSLSRYTTRKYALAALITIGSPNALRAVVWNFHYVYSADMMTTWAQDQIESRSGAFDANVLHYIGRISKNDVWDKGVWEGLADLGMPVYQVLGALLEYEVQVKREAKRKEAKPEFSKGTRCTRTGIYICTECQTPAGYDEGDVFGLCQHHLYKPGKWRFLREFNG